MAQQTAVDWLINSIIEKAPLRSIQIYLEANKDLVQQAKEMEKQQKQYMFDCGRQYQITGEGTFREVYNETYEE